VYTYGGRGESGGVLGYATPATYATAPGGRGSWDIFPYATDTLHDTLQCNLMVFLILFSIVDIYVTQYIRGGSPRRQKPPPETRVPWVLPTPPKSQVKATGAGTNTKRRNPRIWESLVRTRTNPAASRPPGPRRPAKAGHRQCTTPRDTAQAARNAHKKEVEETPATRGVDTSRPVCCTGVCRG